MRRHWRNPGAWKVGEGAEVISPELRLQRLQYLGRKDPSSGLDFLFGKVTPQPS